MAVHKNNHLLLTQNDVIKYNGFVWVVAGASADRTAVDRKYPDRYVRLCKVKVDCTLETAIDADRENVLKNAQYIDGAEIVTRVVLPADMQTQLDEYAAEERGASEMDDEERKDTFHPSFGSIQLHKYSGHAKLFMSPFHHQHFIGISIHRAVKKRSLYEDHMFPEGRSICEVFLSEAQFARFITGHSDGSGTPCTLHHVTGTYFPEPPYEDEKEKFAEDTKQVMDSAANFLEQATNQLRLILEKKGTLTKADKEKLTALVNNAHRKLTDSLPFLHKQMQERMDKIVATAGTEVDAYVNRLSTHLGLKELTGKEPPIRFLDTSKQTPPKKENE
jgi:hypothetical protein